MTMASSSWSSPFAPRNSSPLPLHGLSIGSLTGGVISMIREVLCEMTSYPLAAFSRTRDGVLGGTDVAVGPPGISLSTGGLSSISSVAVVETARVPSAIAASCHLTTSSVATMALGEIIQHGRIFSLESWDKAIIRAALRGQPPLPAASVESQEPTVYVPLGMSTCITESIRTTQMCEALHARGAGLATPVLDETAGFHRWQLAGCQHDSVFKPAEHDELLKLTNHHLDSDESDSDSDSDPDDEFDPSDYFEQPSMFMGGGMPSGDDLIFQMDL